jgi:DNA primase
MANIDFAEIKARVTELQVADMLGLTLKKSGATWRGQCPICKNKNQRALAITPGKGWYCHGDCKAGGDVLELVARVDGVTPREAAIRIKQRFMPEPKKKPWYMRLLSPA